MFVQKIATVLLMTLTCLGTGVCLGQEPVAEKYPIVEPGTIGCFVTVMVKCTDYPEAPDLTGCRETKCGRVIDPFG